LSEANLLRLSASIEETQPLRYTPSGLPALNIVLAHTSTQAEAHSARAVKLTIKAVAFGVVAERLVVQSLGSSWLFTGFLTNAAKGKAIIFHIQDFLQDS
jgi:primosomal replication protein N